MPTPTIHTLHALRADDEVHRFVHSDADADPEQDDRIVAGIRTKRTAATEPDADLAVGYAIDGLTTGHALR